MMHLNNVERHIGSTERHIARLQEHILHQRTIVTRLEAAGGRNSTTAQIARELLDAMKRELALDIAHHDRLAKMVK